MNIEKLIEKKGYENDAVKICKFLGFTDTDQLKDARFFSQEESYSPIPILGVSISNNDYTWRLCKIVDSEEELYSIDHGYKLRFEICDGSGYGGTMYYQCDFLSLLKSGHIVYVKDGSNIHVENIKWAEPLSDNTFVIHEADILVENRS